MKAGIVLPRGMHFSPQGATSIDIVAHELLSGSRFKDQSYVLGASVEGPYSGIDFRPLKARRQNDLISAAIKGLKRDRPDVIVVHQHPESAARIAKALAPTPVVLHRHGLLRAERSWFSKWCKQRQFNRLSGLIFVSGFLRSRFLASYPSLKARCQIAYNSLDTDFWRPAAEKQQTICFVGRARADKGIRELVEAFVSSPCPSWELTLILAVLTEEERQFCSGIEAMTFGHPEIRILRNLTQEGVRDQLATAQIAVFPSIVEEGFHRAAIEAMACGCATIGVNRGGVPEATGGAALLIDQVSPQTIRQPLDRLMSRPEEISRLAAAGRAHVQSKLETRLVCGQYDDLLETIARQRA
ncbi:glycosyltransferase family 4 protein [Roseibium litorale]|uniref:Glycosyltransferase family 4 protein n=1 Tax=Roseibium litorale TaxID=2803841 RepID=A0ABR9CM31_9HYPH|nr:glycosyltransferase family 4 protein [Roseibium litorale]MBD8891921.1 glycosyltransferase family 4 protein [Roseibium litorale]